MSSSPEVSLSATLINYIYPAVVFFYYIASVGFAIGTLQTISAADGPQKTLLRRTTLGVLLFTVFSYVAQLLAILVTGVFLHHFQASQDTIVGLLSCTLVFGLEFVGLLDNEKPVFYPFMGSIGLAVVLEPVTLIVSHAGQTHGSTSALQIFNLSLVSVRCLAFTATIAIYTFKSWGSTCEKATDEEREALVARDNNNYGATTANNSASSAEPSTHANRTPATEPQESPFERRERLAKELMDKRLLEHGNWFTYAKGFLLFLPYVWPMHRPALQVRVFLVGLCLVAMNTLNVLIPRQLGIVMDSLSGTNGHNPWLEVIVFASLKLLASESGITLLQTWLWLPVEFYSSEALSNAAFSHILNLSSDFHDSKSSSDIIMAMHAGQNVSNLLESVCFQAMPMLVDMGAAFVYLSITFGPYEGFITFATACVFFNLAAHMVSGLKNRRRGEISAWFQESCVRQAGIQGWSTVTCFNQVRHEEGRYSDTVKERVRRSTRLQFGYTVAYALQYLVLLCGLLAGAFLAVYQVSHGQATPGQFVMLLTYWSQLVAPLSFFARLGRNISRDLIAAERLLDIMTTKPTVTSKEGAQPLHFIEGRVRFDHVHFSYDNKKHIIKDVSFVAKPGQTIAFVGSTGAGKSTILKLLDRFYDVTQGSIEIDGQDIRDVELHSLRAQIGVVPQSPILFDDTIMNNVRYARLSAEDEEVFEACKAACIHDQIMEFSDGYNTRVGERGVKLSGGELQRVAIARALLKKPSIVLLDEATSAVDTDTESKIQDALATLCSNRTTFVVAHRLSTTMNADRIVVMGGGEIIEEGTHDELIKAGGRYAELWSKQFSVRPKAEDKGKAAESAHVKEESRLNPDAPTFTPRGKDKATHQDCSPTRLGRSMDGFFDMGTPSPAAAGMSVAQHLSQPSFQYLAAPIMMMPAPYVYQPPAPPVVIRSNPFGHVFSRRRDRPRDVMSIEEEAGSNAGGTPTSSSPVQRQPSTVHQGQPGSCLASSPRHGQRGDRSSAGPPRVNLKHPRYSRRVQSKSEPSVNSSACSPPC